MLYIKYIKNGQFYFMVANKYSEIPKGVQIVYVERAETTELV